MSGIDFIADTNILFYLLSGNKHVEPYKGSQLGISIITEIEMLGWYHISNEEEEIIKGLMNELTIFPLNDRIKELTIQLKQEHRIKIPDAIIGATSQWFNSPLLTADKDFRNIDGLNAIILDF